MRKRVCKYVSSFRLRQFPADEFYRPFFAALVDLGQDCSERHLTRVRRDDESLAQLPSASLHRASLLTPF